MHTRNQTGFARQAGTILLLSLLLLAACTPQASTPPDSSEIGNGNNADNATAEAPDRITARAIDGASLQLSTGERVHLLCIQTPKPHEKGNPAATARLDALLQSGDLRLEQRPGVADTNETLYRNVYVDDVLVNPLLVEEGLARVVIVTSRTSYCDTLKFLQDEAQTEGREMWHINPICDVNFYDCTDFESEYLAQQVLNACDGRDVHKLDSDDDGLACDRASQRN